MTNEYSQQGVSVQWPVSSACIRNIMGKPAYVLIAHSSDPNRGRGEKYNVEVYISGVGDVDYSAGNPGLAAAKLYVSIPAYIPETIERKSNGTRLSVKSTYLEYTEIKSPDDFKAIHHEELVPNAFDLTVSHYFFTKKFYNNNPNDLGVEGERIVWNKQWWQDDNYYYAPISFSFTVANNAPSGDHNIYLHLVYKDCLRWYSNCATLKIHIKEWYEEDLIRALVIFAAFGSIVSGYYALNNLLGGFRAISGFAMIAVFAMSVYLTIKDLQKGRSNDFIEDHACIAAKPGSGQG